MFVQHFSIWHLKLLKRFLLLPMELIATKKAGVSFVPLPGILKGLKKNKKILLKPTFFAVHAASKSLKNEKFYTLFGRFSSRFESKLK